MTRNTYLRICGGRYDWRRRVPAHLVARLMQKELIKSIGSVPYAVALRHARRLTMQSDDLFALMTKNPTLSPADAAAIVQEWYTEMVSAGERTHTESTITVAAAAERIGRNKGTVEGLRLALAANDTSQVSALSDRLLGERRADVEPGSDEERHFRKLVLRGALAAAETMDAMAAGNFGFQPADELFRAIRQADGQAVAPTFSVAFDAYVAEKKRTGGRKGTGWQADMIKENDNSKGLFLEWLGDKRVDRYRRSDVAGFSAMLQSLPAMRGKTYKGSLKELVALSQCDPSVAVLSPKSVKKHMDNISSFFSWCAGQGHIEANPAKGVFKFKCPDRRNAQREEWTVDQLHKLFSSPVFHGAKSDYYRSQPGDVLIKDHRYWMPLLAAFHPIRLEEMAQLRLIDIRAEGDIVFFDIRENHPGEEDGFPPRKLKTPAARRRMPLHPILRELGFMDFIDEKRRNKTVVVFDDLVPKGTADRFGYTYTKWFPNYRAAIGIKGVTFHSFRHSAISALARADVSEVMRNQLEGHEEVGEFGRYFKGFDLKAAADAIAKIRYDGIDAAFIRGEKKAPF